MLFEDESFSLGHGEVGLLSLVNQGGRGNGNVFRILAGACPELDGKSVVFGGTVDEQSAKVVRAVAGLAVGNDYRPRHPVVIRECGEM